MPFWDSPPTSWFWKSVQKLLYSKVFPWICSIYSLVGHLARLFPVALVGELPKQHHQILLSNQLSNKTRLHQNNNLQRTWNIYLKGSLISLVWLPCWPQCNCLRHLNWRSFWPWTAAPTFLLSERSSVPQNTEHLNEITAKTHRFYNLEHCVHFSGTNRFRN